MLRLCRCRRDIAFRGLIRIFQLNSCLIVNMTDPGGFSCIDSMIIGCEMKCFRPEYRSDHYTTVDVTFRQFHVFRICVFRLSTQPTTMKTFPPFPYNPFMLSFDWRYHIQNALSPKPIELSDHMLGDWLVAVTNAVWTDLYRNRCAVPSNVAMSGLNVPWKIGRGEGHLHYILTIRRSVKT